MRIILSSLAALFVGALLLLPDSGDPVALINSLDGAALYKAYCAACHGVDAKGNGPTASALRVSPPDLTRIAERNGGVFPMARIERIITGDHRPDEMPLWGPIFSQVGPDQDLGRVRIDNLTRYLMRVQVSAAASIR